VIPIRKWALQWQKLLCATNKKISAELADKVEYSISALGVET